MNSSEKLRTIQELARRVVDICSEYKDDESSACMTSASEIFELAESLLETKGMEEHYGLRVEGRKKDDDRVSGSRLNACTVRYASSAEDLRSEHTRSSLERASNARARTRAAKTKKRKPRAKR